ncbi:MAG: hypothetical protein FWE54_03675 [Methanimicrococcus sp.]|nr:hypothetical protein [Methanimicrococcus sp.]
MKEVLQDIYIGRTSLDSIEFKYDTIEVPLHKGEGREFQIFVKNFASPTHITFLPDDSIRDYLILVPSKHRIQNNEYIKIVIRIPYNSSSATEGMFYVVTGYGAQKKGFKLSVGADLSRKSTLSAGGDLSGLRLTDNPAGDVYKSEGPITSADSGRAQLVYDDEEDETKKKAKPAFGIKNGWESKAGKPKPQSSPPKSDKYGAEKKAPSLPIIERVTIFVSLVLIVLLLALFVFIQFAELEAVFPFDQTFLLALIAVGFIIFLVLLLSLFLRRMDV